MIKSPAGLHGKPFLPTKGVVLDSLTQQMSLSASTVAAGPGGGVLPAVGRGGCGLAGGVGVLLDRWLLSPGAGESVLTG